MTEGRSSSSSSASASSTTETPTTGQSALAALWTNAAGNFNSGLNFIANWTTCAFNIFLKYNGSVVVIERTGVSSQGTDTFPEGAPITQASGRFVHSRWTYIRLAQDLEAFEQTAAVKMVKEFRDTHGQCSYVTLGGEATFRIDVVRAMGASGKCHVKQLDCEHVGVATPSHWTDLGLKFNATPKETETETGLRVTCVVDQRGSVPWKTVAAESYEIVIWGDGSVEPGTGMFKGLEAQLTTPPPARPASLARRYIQQDLAAVVENKKIFAELEIEFPDFFATVTKIIEGWGDFKESTQVNTNFEMELRNGLFAGEVHILENLGAASWLLIKARTEYYLKYFTDRGRALANDQRDELYKMIDAHRSDEFINAAIGSWNVESDIVALTSNDSDNPSSYFTEMEEDSEGRSKRTGRGTKRNRENFGPGDESPREEGVGSSSGPPRAAGESLLGNPRTFGAPTTFAGPIPPRPPNDGSARGRKRIRVEDRTQEREGTSSND